MAAKPPLTPSTTPAAGKTQRKSLPPHLTPGNPGNSGGKPGRSGRIPNAFKDFLADLRADPTARDALKAAASDPTNRNFGNAWKLIADYDDEKPAEKRENRVMVTLEYMESDE